MTEEHDATSGGRTESELVFEADHFQESDAYERVAEGYKQQGDRRVIYGYDLDHTRASPLLRVHARCYRRADERGHTTRTFRVEDGVVTQTGQDLTAFIEADFEARDLEADFETVTR